MGYTFKTFSDDIELRQVDQLVEPWRALIRRTPPRGGWLRLVREALGMTTRQVAQRLQMSQSNIVQLEKAERQGSVSLKRMRQAANALGCELVYAVVPRKPIQVLREERARYRARQQLNPILHSMALEDQEPSEKVQDELLKKQIQSLLSGPPSKLWDEKS